MSNSLPPDVVTSEVPDQPTASRVVVEMIGTELKITLPRPTFGRRSAIVTVDGDRLQVEHRGRTEERARRQLADIRVARLIDSEGPDTFQVHIDPHPGEGKRVRLPVRDEPEANWLAATIRQALGIPEAGDESAPFLERAEPPAGCPIVEEPLPDGIQFIVPPMGFQHPNVRYYGLLGLGYLAIGLVVGGFLYVADGLGHISIDDFLQLVWLVPVLFGLGFLAAVEEVIRRAGRHAMLSVGGNTLRLQQTNLYRTRRCEWPRSRIVDVRVGNNLEKCRLVGPRTQRVILDQTDPTWELHIHLRDGELVRLFDGYGDAELQWLATALRQALRVPVGAVCR
jgi:hypothetical protein